MRSCCVCLRLPAGTTTFSRGIPLLQGYSHWVATDSISSFLGRGIKWKWSRLAWVWTVFESLHLLQGCESMFTHTHTHTHTKTHSVSAALTLPVEAAGSSQHHSITLLKPQKEKRKNLSLLIQSTKSKRRHWCFQMCDTFTLRITQVKTHGLLTQNQTH